MNKLKYYVLLPRGNNKHYNIFNSYKFCCCLMDLKARLKKTKTAKDRDIKEEFDAGKLPRKRNFDKNKRYETVKGNINKYKNMWNKLKEFVENKMETSSEPEWYTLEEIQLEMKELEE